MSSHYDFDNVSQDDNEDENKILKYEKIICISQDDHVEKICILYYSYYFTS
jgi:hypothetical protein